MSHNSFGNLLKFTTWGESHGDAIGCVVDGFPAGIPIDTKYIQTRLNLRKPGQSKFTTQRKEKDEINICLLYTSPSPRDRQKSRMPSSA